MSLTPDFWEKLLLLVAAGFLIPIVLKTIDYLRSIQEKKNDEQRDKARKIFEAELARQNTILDAQSKFLDEISKILWKWRYMTLKVVYYGKKVNQKEKYRQAKAEFDKGIWDVFNQMRYEISRSRRLISEQAYNNLLELYEDLQDIDNKISKLVETKFDADSINEYRELYRQRISHVSVTIDKTLNDLARELQLKGSQTASPPASAPANQSDGS
ncbi:MAG TPA: hypothetical protein VF658_11460 [Pyrinomonadaceae bacterium]|jgi:hypothetical protein